MLHGEAGGKEAGQGDMICKMTIQDQKEGYVRDLAAPTQDVARHLAGFPLSDKAKNERASNRSRALKHMLWKGQLYRSVRTASCWWSHRVREWPFFGPLTIRLAIGIPKQL